jgi:K+-sensing histidine kinase KdpD
MVALTRHGLGLLFVAGALGVSLFLQRFFPYPFLFLFFAAVMASAWFGGLGPGFLAVISCTLAVDYSFVRPLHSFAINATDSAYFAAFIISAGVASWVSASKKKTEEALREARDKLELRVAERTAQLEESLTELQEKERQRQKLESEKSSLSERLETRKLIERAKGILQRDLNISEEEAYRALQRDSQQRRKPMREIAESLILIDDLKRSAH